MTDVSTTCAVAIFRMKVRFITSVAGLKLFHQKLNTIDNSLTSALPEKKCREFFAPSNFLLSDQPKLLSSSLSSWCFTLCGVHIAAINQVQIVY